MRGVTDAPGANDADDTRPDDTQPIDVRPDDARPVAAQPDDARPDDARPDDAQPDDARPVAALPVDDLPLLDDLMPWSVAPLRLGRSWIVAPDARTLRSRWDRLVAAEGAEREALFRPSRARTPASTVAALPGQRTGTVRWAREPGPCPEPVRIACGPFDERLLLPDHRLIDTARPELWRVAGNRSSSPSSRGTCPVRPAPRSW